MAKSVKVVAKTADAARASANAIENQRVSITKSGVLAKGTAKPIEARNAKNIIPKDTIKIRTNPGISGKGGAMVGGLYKPIGGGGLPQYNK